MPIEYAMLKNKQEPKELCPKCGQVFESFLRGHVQSGFRAFFGRPYCAVICRACKEIVGWEKPLTEGEWTN